ncbi:hypothetical protein QYE76_071483 [Lolium multiflorum]|uniref:Reverse transcriptase Ty1/copia-type domain-containing protein n=1 Tax=Lolium multiflorum TaxID=4521 RepID=A0AAD8SLF5_LOLMU|nr:hypothetical protein QYE76_071483 [Lolium multiflorum]
MAYLLLYVDDIILTATLDFFDTTDSLRAEFALKDLGPLHYFLGIEVVRRADGFFLHQRKYAHELLERAGCSTATPHLLPSTRRPSSDGSLASDAPFYRSIVCPSYLTLTRPELHACSSSELSCPVDKATVVFCDNVSAVYLSANPVHHRRTKHIELDIHFVREQVALGRVRPALLVLCNLQYLFYNTDHFLDYVAYMAEVAKEEGTLDRLPVQLNNMDEKEAWRLTILVCQQRKPPTTYQL